MNKTIFATVLLVLFTLGFVQPVHEMVVRPFTEGLAVFCAGLLKVFDSDVVSGGVVIRSLSSGAAISIDPGCNGSEAMMFLTAAIVAYSSTFLHKLAGLLVGYLAIQFVNILRIISLFYILQWDEQWFEWAHLYAGQALIFLDVLIVFILWVRWLPVNDDEPRMAVAQRA